MRVLITGAGGMLGKDLAAALASKHEVAALSHADCDITVESDVQRIFQECRPELAVNCAAYADVDGCERNRERALAVNGLGPGILARAAERIGARLYHISTDYVFDGTKPAPYTEDDPPNPINYYGLTKLEGERRILAHDGRIPSHLVIRTSWLYGLHRSNFVEKVLEKARTRSEVEAVADQVSCPTWTAHLAEKIAELVDRPVAGILHVVNGGQCSRYEFARAIVEQLPGSVVVKPIEWQQLHLPARRPSYSVLGGGRLEALGLAPLPHWKQALREYLSARQSVALAEGNVRKN